MAKISHRFLPVVYLYAATLMIFNASAQEIKQHVAYYESDNVTNQIPYFDNRFRLDAQLDEITLIFYRKLGTPPIILVRPDGSKLKITDLPKDDSVSWYDDTTYDMIKIKKPTPGPWQAIGDILPQSKIMVVSDVSIEVEPIPEIVLAGETLKMTGKLINGKQAINNPLFRDVVSLDVDFYSTNNSAYDNFGAEPINLTTFRDDGEELDEYGHDGIFTGEFLLNFAPGEWVPVYIVKLPMVTRELRQKPIVIQRTPITITADTTLDEHDAHKIIFTIDPTHVDPDSIIMQGKFTLPDRQSEPFSVMEGEGETRIEKLGFTEPGIHRVNVNVFGKTNNGREFRLVVPEFVFNVERTEILGPTSDMGNKDSTALTAENESTQLESLIVKKQNKAEELKALLDEQRMQAEKEEAEMYTLIAIVNGVVIFMFAVGVGVYLWRKRQSEKKEKVDEA